MKTKHRSGKRNPDEFSAGGASYSENLDEYIRVSRPGTKIVLAALLIVLAAVIVWGLIGKLPVTETVKGLVVNQEMAEELYSAEDDEKKLDVYTKEYPVSDYRIYCFVDASRYNMTQVRNFVEKAVIEMPDQHRLTGKIVSSIGVPLSKQACEEILFGNEWVTERSVQSDYSWWLIIEPDEDVRDYAFMLSEVTIVTEEVAPISFLAGKGR